MKHLSKDDLAKFADGHMNFARTVICRLHISGCDTCRALLEEIRSDDELIQSLRTARNRHREVETECGSGEILGKLEKKLGKSRISNA